MGFEPHAAARLRLMALTAADPTLRAELAAMVRRDADPESPIDAAGEPCPACAAAHARALARANGGSSGADGRPAVARAVPGLAPRIASRR